MTDYKQILIKYINEVGACEGVSFIPPVPKKDQQNINHSKDDFTYDELVALNEIGEIALKRWNQRMNDE